MRFIRLIQTPVVLFTLAFSVVALGILPTALCCQAVVNAAGSEDEPCPHAGADGDACPLHRSEPPREPSHCPSMTSCSTDTLLQSLVTLTGAMPEPRLVTDFALVVDAMLVGEELSEIDVDRPPHAPPPRA